MEKKLNKKQQDALLKIAMQTMLSVAERGDLAATATVRIFSTSPCGALNGRSKKPTCWASLKNKEVAAMTALALKTYSTAQLLDLWELTTSNPNEYIPVVRGWLMDELESRHPEAFDKWLDGDAEDADLRKYIEAEEG